jgi:hypothetical protein
MGVLQISLVKESGNDKTRSFAAKRQPSFFVLTLLEPQRFETR